MTTRIPESGLSGRAAMVALVAIAIITPPAHSDEPPRATGAPVLTTSAPIARSRLAAGAINLTPERMAELTRQTREQPPVTDPNKIMRRARPKTAENWLTRWEPRYPGPPVPADINDDPDAFAPRAFNYAPRMTRSFNAFDATVGGGSPPDPHIAVGPNHIATVVNFRMTVFSKTGVEVFAASLSNFFAVSGTQPGAFDPKIMYDEQSQRFFALSLGLRDQCAVESWLYFACSQTSDPTQGWWIYHERADFDGHWLDYPGLGVGQNGLYMAGQYVPNSGCAPGASHWCTFWALPKAPMLSGGGFSFWVFDDFRDPEGDPTNIKPAVALSVPPAGLDGFALYSGENAGSACVLTFGITLPTNFPTSPPSFNMRFSPTVSTPPGLVLAQQRGGPGLITTWNVGSPPLEAYFANGRLWTCSHYGSGTTPARTALRYYEVDVSSWPSISLSDTDELWDGTSYYFWPEIAANHHGDAVMVFCRSRPTVGTDPGEFVGSRWTVRLADETSLVASNWLAQGTHYMGDEVNDPGATPVPEYRWGDYGGAAVDPIDHGFWVFHEHAVENPNNANQGTWATQIGYIPRAVFVDRAYAGVERGTRPRPFNTVSEGHVSALAGNDLVIRTGAYPEALVINKAVAIVPDGGVVTIGTATP